MLPVITITREFGSGGHSIAKKVAEELNLPFLDGEIITQAVRESGYCREIIEEQGENASGANMWFNVSAASTMYFQSPQDEIFLAQRKIILEAAKKGPCVIVGRCSDYILHEEGIRRLSVFVHSDMDSRKKRVLERYGDIPEIGVEKRILKKDKERMTYYRYYTDQHWGDYRNYELALDSGSLGEDNCVAVICNLAKDYPENK